MQKDFVCDECFFVFRVYAEARRRGRPKPFYCPNCGDNFRVREHTEVKSKPNEYKRIPWTAEEVRTLKKHLAQGLQRHQIALILGRTSNSVHCKIKSMQSKE